MAVPSAGPGLESRQRRLSQTAIPLELGDAVPGRLSPVCLQLRNQDRVLSHQVLLVLWLINPGFSSVFGNPSGGQHQLLLVIIRHMLKIELS